MWTDRQRTKTNPKTSPEQSAIFQLVQEINKTNANYVTSIVKTAPTPCSHFHDNWAENVTSRVHVIQLTGTIFQLDSRIKGTYVLTKFHENWAKNVTSKTNAPPTGGHVFSPIWTIFKLVRDINKTNVLINFHGDWAKIVTSRVFTRKTAPPTGCHVFQWTGTTFEHKHIGHEIFELDRDFMGTKLLTKFHEDWTINVASRVFTNKCYRRRTKTGHKSSPEQSVFGQTDRLTY
ncbi:hypothetical protein DPMN_100245 [Dreissena polymorpha]|uniref:Uncharacterized protein n=1 Tax=Dreissena polymorpha TaxID=45954 RepID=A0A9D4LH11_DREPO|nr:hypothetical protein DPMN_100245 [Dreissena polymorpha]